MSDDLDNFRGSRYIKLLLLHALIRLNSDPFNSSLVSSRIAFLDFDSVSSGGDEDDLRKVFEGKCVCVCVCVTRKWLRKDGEIN